MMSMSEMTNAVQRPKAKTPKPMSEAHTDTDKMWIDKANGIVPGYAGHVPMGRDKYGASHVGGLAKTHLAHQHPGAQARHDKKLDVEAKNSKNILYRNEIGGMLPGFGGFRPGAAEEYGQAAYGGVPRGPSGDGTFGQNRRDTSTPEAPKPSFRENNAGVLPGYTGFVPNKFEKFGTSHFGGVRGQPKHQGNRPGLKQDKDVMGVDQMVKPGYSGHVPGARDAFGGSYCFEP